MKYIIKLSMYATVAEHADITIEADSRDKAEEKALKLAEDGYIKFSHLDEPVEDWNYQVEYSKEL